MVKIGESATESHNRWDNLTYEQVKLLVFETNLLVSKIVAEMEVKLVLLTVNSSTHEWYNLLSLLEKELENLRECLPSYSYESYKSLEDTQHRDILEEFKQFNKRKNYQEQYLKLKVEIFAIEKFLFETAPAKRENEEFMEKLNHLRAQINSHQSFIKEVKATIRCVTSEIVREKKAYQREASLMKTQRANALQRLEELRDILTQKEELLKETAEQRQREYSALQNEIHENKRLLQTLNVHMDEQKVVQEKVRTFKNDVTK